MKHIASEMRERDRERCVCVWEKESKRERKKWASTIENRREFFGMRSSPGLESSYRLDGAAFKAQRDQNKEEVKEW